MQYISRVIGDKVWKSFYRSYDSRTTVRPLYVKLQANIASNNGFIGPLPEEVDCVILWLSYRLLQKDVPDGEVQLAVELMESLLSWMRMHDIAITVKEMEFLLMGLFYQNCKHDMTYSLNTLKKQSVYKNVGSVYAFHL